LAARRPRPADTAPALPRTLSYRLHQVHKLTDQESQRRYPLEAGLSLADARCLVTVGAFEPLSVKDLALRANLDKGQASRAAQWLADQGLVEKADHPGDGRGVVLTLTAAGRRASRRAMDFIVRRNDEIFGCLSAAEQALLGELLDRLVAHAQQPTD
jgi:DNA-binding MarR family transcriptional regulator